ncbi:hypothetical protein [Natronosalvus amylolyticus]|uniref:hypothetical protein n=1 Tax=Natronosalvus amylolyticus TaxID=2961994 RepID=UPI0020C9ACF1|nr:hypothetical protein [Natronosalvus amylolyticus]
MKRHTLVAAMLAAAMILSALAPLGAAAAATDNGESDFTIDVEQNGEIVVTVEQNDSALENATLEVSVDDENASYADAGNHTTDENGTVTLDTPEESVNVTLSVDNVTEDKEVLLEAADDGEEDDEEKTDSFGTLISQFVQSHQGETDGPLGIAVANFAVENNPGNAPDHAGPPSHAGPSDDGEQGPPAHAGPGGDDEDSDEGDDDDDRGPPAHAGPGGDDEESDDGDETEEEEESDDGDETEEEEESDDGDETEEEEESDEEEGDDEDSDDEEGDDEDSDEEEGDDEDSDEEEGDDDDSDEENGDDDDSDEENGDDDDGDDEDGDDDETDDDADA